MRKVLVIRGGPSDEYSVSLESGKKVSESLKRQNYNIRDVIISRQGEWLEDGRQKTINQALEGVDLVFIALHGHFGEDGQIQKLLRNFSVPFTGSDALPSALAFNKAMAKETVKRFGLLSPDSVILRRSDITSSLYSVAANIKSSFGPEYIIKPINSGSSLGINLVRPGESLADALYESLANFEEVLVEEFIRGKEATVPVIEKFREQPIYAFPAIEIIPPRSEPFFTYHAKYSGETAEICPGNFTYLEKDRLAEAAILAHSALGLSQLSRTDFIVRNGDVYFLETNTIPGLTSESLVPKAAAAVGLNYDQLVAHLVDTVNSG